MCVAIPVEAIVGVVLWPISYGILVMAIPVKAIVGVAVGTLVVLFVGARVVRLASYSREVVGNRVGWCDGSCVHL